jgi:hypothetical protein
MQLGYIFYFNYNKTVKPMLLSNLTLGRNVFFIALFLLTSLLFNSIHAQNCKSELVVDKDRNTRSADEDGAEFTLILTNKDFSKATFNLTSVFLKESCSTNYNSTKMSNVKLDVSFKTSESYGLGSNSITLNAGESKSFKVLITVPDGTPFNRWSCIEIQANSGNCSNSDISTLLKVYVPDPNEG